MNKCISLLILSLSLMCNAFEHTVVTGDSLWSLSKRYLGSGSLWRTVTYADGSMPDEQYLTVGRLLRFNAAAQSDFGSSADRHTASENNASTSISNNNTLAFNTRLYCCGLDTVVMHPNGHFEITSEPHPFMTPPQVTKQKMVPFMNINISQELIDALD